MLHRWTVSRSEWGGEETREEGEEGTLHLCVKEFWRRRVFIKGAWFSESPATLTKTCHFAFESKRERVNPEQAWWEEESARLRSSSLRGLELIPVLQINHSRRLEAQITIEMKDQVKTGEKRGETRTEGGARAALAGVSAGDRAGNRKK